MPKSKKQDKLEQKNGELLLDLQRTRADFENYRKRMDLEKAQAVQTGEAKAIMKLLPTIDNIERAIAHAPKELAEDKWVQSVIGLTKQLDKSLETLGLKRINASEGSKFNPEMHEAIQFDEDAEGDTEVIEAELQAGYTLHGTPIRHAMVKVTKQ